MGLSPLTFTGVSQFSSDLQAILDRAVRIAQLPVQGLQNRTSDVLQKKLLLGQLSGSVAGLADSLQALGDVAARRALAASSSRPSTVSVTNTGATAAATYTINSVTSLAAPASERTQAGYADSTLTPVGSTGHFRLVVGADEYDFELSNNTLVGLRDHINSLSAGVLATILTTGDGNYLSVSTTTPGATTLALYDDPEGANTNLLTAGNQGSDLVFRLNGIPVTQQSNLVNSVVPGLTFTIHETTASPVQLQLAPRRTDLSSALSNFVSSFNALRDAVNAQTGPAAGLLSGNVLIHRLSAQLRAVAHHRRDTGAVRSLADLGVTFSSAGRMEFDSAKLNALNEAQLEDAFLFLGSANTGLGGFARGLRQFTDPIHGLIALEQRGLDRVDQALQRQIAALNERIDLMRRGMQRRLQQADALLAQIESQQNTVKASLQGLNLVLYGRNDR
jgi:flagellar hook-associated protein 2